MRLLLIRHGQTPNNVVGALDTAFPGAGLTNLGLAQAAAIPQALLGESIAAIYVSPLHRTHLTAAPLAEALGLEITVKPGLEEVLAGDYEMSSDEESVHGYVDCLISWMNGDRERSMPGAQDGHEFWNRFDGAIRTIAADHGPDDTVAVISHGAALRVFTAIAAQLDYEAAVELHIANTGMGILTGDPESGWQLERWIAEPVGGAHLLDASAHDVTGESADEVADE